MNKRTVLLADDDPGLRRLVGATLGSEHFHLLAAADGEQGQLFCRSSDFPHQMIFSNRVAES